MDGTIDASTLYLPLQPSQMRVINKTENVERFFDEEKVIEEREILYQFSNGVIILCKMESDTFQADELCRECWISYEVVHGGCHAVPPRKKQLYNRCQEACWVKMQSEHT
ncbi:MULTISPECIES: hypothetical protein [Serratia]|nr:hypothetical protein [Serratia marcescens]EME1464172.1 hypothetical protein [Serratia marcescens]MBN3914431.1 hypothetical protein [Serratia marcescens]MBN3933786.1 hypothetical protein [Serratia marcescens]MBN3954943.1 hypothetical protein [Serratia marcescens]MBN3971038.1 hypothetical protein [Serratia marcescens]